MKLKIFAFLTFFCLQAGAYEIQKSELQEDLAMLVLSRADFISLSMLQKTGKPEVRVELEAIRESISKSKAAAAAKGLDSSQLIANGTQALTRWAVERTATEYDRAFEDFQAAIILNESSTEALMAMSLFFDITGDPALAKKWAVSTLQRGAIQDFQGPEGESKLLRILDLAGSQSHKVAPAHQRAQVATAAAAHMVSQSAYKNYENNEAFHCNAHSLRGLEFIRMLSKLSTDYTGPIAGRLLGLQSWARLELSDFFASPGEVFSASRLRAVELAVMELSIAAKLSPNDSLRRDWQEWSELALKQRERLRSVSSAFGMKLVTIIKNTAVLPVTFHTRRIKKSSPDGEWTTHTLDGGQRLILAADAREGALELRYKPFRESIFDETQVLEGASVKNKAAGLEYRFIRTRASSGFMNLNPPPRGETSISLVRTNELSLDE